MIEILPALERPRERCLSRGARCLSLRECLAVILGSGPSGQGALGTAQMILERPDWSEDEYLEEDAFFHAMECAGDGHLQDIRGLGNAGRARILAAFELGRRYSLFRERSQNEPWPDRSPHDQHERALGRISDELRCEPSEWLGFIPVLTSGKLGHLCVVERGVRTHVNVDPASLFAKILSLRPRAFYLFHNHPSGMLLPSPEDLQLTRNVEHIGHTLNVPMLGHAVISPRASHWIVV